MSFTVKIKLLIFVISLFIGIYGYNTINRLGTENALLRSNQEILLRRSNAFNSALREYKIQDSLKAVKINALQLTLDEYSKYRLADAELIKKLQINNSDLQRIIATQASTVSNLQASLKDTILLKSDSSKIAAQSFQYLSLWTDITGTITNDSAYISITNREALQIVETVKYKRFLGFLWKTNRIKAREVDVISKNPATTITNIDYIHIVE